METQLTNTDNPAEVTIRPTSLEDRTSVSILKGLEFDPDCCIYLQKVWI